MLYDPVICVSPISASRAEVSPSALAAAGSVVPNGSATYSRTMNALIIGGVVCSFQQPPEQLRSIVVKLCLRIRMALRSFDYRGLPECLMYDWAVVSGLKVEPFARRLH